MLCHLHATDPLCRLCSAIFLFFFLVFFIPSKTHDTKYHPIPRLMIPFSVFINSLKIVDVTWPIKCWRPTVLFRNIFQSLPNVKDVRRRWYACHIFSTFSFLNHIDECFFEKQAWSQMHKIQENLLKLL